MNDCCSVELKYNSCADKFQAYTHIHRIISIQFKYLLLIANMHIHLLRQGAILLKNVLRMDL